MPQIVKWPGKVEAGSVSNHVTGFEDWLPTLLDLIDSEAGVPEGVNGLSIAPTLLGEEQEERRFLYREFTGYGGQQAVWLGERWKGIRRDLLKKGNENPLEIHLFDMQADPSESTNVASENPEVLAEIEGLMKSERVPSEAFPIPVLDALSE